jgi:hypothetical protein
LLEPFPAWPVAERTGAARRVVLLRALRGGPYAKQSDDDEVLDHVLDALGAGDVLPFELATPDSTTTPLRPGMRPAVRVGVAGDAPMTPSLAETCRTDLRQALDGEPAALLADEVAVVIPMGAKALVTGALLAAVDWSLHAALPLTVLFSDGDHGEMGFISSTTNLNEDDGRPLAVLGLDDMLIQLASRALAALDLMLASALLRRGSSRLRDVADEVRQLHHDAFGVLDPSANVRGDADRTSRSEIELAVARLHLCTAIVGTRPWDAAYLATSVADHTFRMPPRDHGRCAVEGVGNAFLTKKRGWVLDGDDEPPAVPGGKEQWCYLVPWHMLRLPAERRKGMPATPDSASCRLRQWRNDHPLSHGLNPPEGKSTKRTIITVPAADEIADLLKQAEEELGAAIRASYPQFNQHDAGELLTRLDALRAAVEQLRHVAAAGQPDGAAEA